MLKRLIMVLLAMSLVLVLVAQPSAKVCVFKLGGTCLAWSGSLECSIAASGLGNCLEDPSTFTCTGSATTTWLVACGNPGTNNWTAPGINLVYFDGTLSGDYTVTEQDCSKNGRADVTVYADPNADLLAAAVAAGACPNNNWVAIDAVPCNMTLVDREYDSSDCLVADATFDCSLPDCETLGWDSVTQHFERRQYNCTRNEYNVYNPPICPP